MKRRRNVVMYMHTDNMFVNVVIVPLRIHQPSCNSLNSRRLRCCQEANNNFLYAPHVSSSDLPQHSLLRDLLTYKFFVQFWKAVKLKNNFNNINWCWFIGLKKQKLQIRIFGFRREMCWYSEYEYLYCYKYFGVLYVAIFALGKWYTTSKIEAFKHLAI